MTYKKVVDAIGPHVTKVAANAGHEFELHLTLQQMERGKSMVTKKLLQIIWMIWMIDKDRLPSCNLLKD